MMEEAIPFPSLPYTSGATRSELHTQIYNGPLLIRRFQNDYAWQQQHWSHPTHRRVGA